MITVNNREIEFHQGMTLAEAIEESGEMLDTMTLYLWMTMCFNMIIFMRKCWRL